MHNILDQIGQAGHDMTFGALNQRKKRSPAETMALHKDNQVGISQRGMPVMTSTKKGPGMVLNMLAGVQS